MKEKWAPGPWEVERWTDRFAIVADGGEHEDDAVICERRASATSKVALAEMHLMAASPDMFAACVAALDRLAQLGPAHQDVCRTLTAAIDKALGDSQ